MEKPTKKQRDFVLAQTKQINSLKVKRNKLKIGSIEKQALQKIIDLAEKDLKAKRKKLGI